jgi:type I restriction enzyme S subunit
MAKWVTTRLSEVCSIAYGFTASSTTIPVGPRFLRITDIQNGQVCWDSVPYCRIAPEKISRYKLEGGDVVFSRTGATTGKSFLVMDPPDAVFASYLIRLRVERNAALPEYLNYFFQTSEYWEAIRVGSVGAAQGGFNATKLGEVRLPVPSIAEQERIVAILDEAFEGIAFAKANAEKNVANSRSLFQSHLHSVFSRLMVESPRVRISEVCASIMDCVNKTAPVIEGPTPFKMIRTTNVRFGMVNLDSVRFVEEDTYRKWTRREVPTKGDILLTREAPMGEVGMLTTDDKVFLGQRIVSYRPAPSFLNSRYLLYALQSHDLQGQIAALASGSTVQHMRVPDSKALKLSLPTLIEQHAIVERIDQEHEAASQLEANCLKKIEALDQLEQSLLHQAFTGKL